MISWLWKKIKSISLLRESIANIYYFLKKVRKRIRGIGNKIQIDLQNNFPFIQNIVFDVNGNNNTVFVGSGTRLSNSNIFIWGDNNRLTIMNNVQGSCDLWIVGNECQIVIGEYTTIVKATIGVSEVRSSVFIGKDCMFAHEVDIRSSDSHSIIDVSTNKRINFAKDISIGNHVWIAPGVKVLKGVCIDDNSIIAAGAVVTKDIPSNCIAAGVPAQVKRTGVTWIR